MLFLDKINNDNVKKILKNKISIPYKILKYFNIINDVNLCKNIINLTINFICNLINNKNLLNNKYIVKYDIITDNIKTLLKDYDDITPFSLKNGTSDNKK